MLTKFFNHPLIFAIAALLGLGLGWADLAPVNGFAYAVSEVFIRLLKLVSLPIIFLSLLATASGMENMQQFKTMGSKVIRYTLLTTVLAALVALGFFLFINPVNSSSFELVQTVSVDKTSYLEYLLKAIPSNIVRPFVENHVIGVMIIAILMSLAVLSLPNENRKLLHSVFQSLFLAIMKITTWIVKTMPIAVFAFLVLFVKDMRAGLDATTVALYLTCVVGANLFQAFVILPGILKWKGIPPLKLAKSMLPALSLAFFSKSSSATIPMAIKCATERAGISPRVSNFVLPLCTTINMNGCAAFILTTVLFVSMSQGMVWTFPEMIGWVLIATVAAVGNAGVPMGCYFLSSAILAAMNVPLTLLGVILPFYAMIDMVETSINVWSDSCVTAVVAQDATEEIKTAPILAEKTIPLFP